MVDYQHDVDDQHDHDGLDLASAINQHRQSSTMSMPSVNLNFGTSLHQPSEMAAIN